MSSKNQLAKILQRLLVPGKPLVLTNVWDAASARAVGQVPAVKALATASYAVAAAAGLEDSELSLEANLAAVRIVAKVADSLGKPLTVDLQNAYGDRLEEAVASVIELGAVGINIEDYDKDNQRLYPINEAAERVKRVLTEAKKHGVPDFVINARTDTLVHGGPLEEAIERGKAYLAAGAATVFVWGGSKRPGISNSEVASLSKAFDGRLNVILRYQLPDALTVKELSEIGIARISLGPRLQLLAMETITSATEQILTSV
jgi:2-methylisocitrate lyase-like PEP mutase family enzyme